MKSKITKALLPFIVAGTMAYNVFAEPVVKSVKQIFNPAGGVDVVVDAKSTTRNADIDVDLWSTGTTPRNLRTDQNAPYKFRINPSDIGKTLEVQAYETANPTQRVKEQIVLGEGAVEPASFLEQTIVDDQLNQFLRVGPDPATGLYTKFFLMANGPGFDKVFEAFPEKSRNHLCFKPKVKETSGGTDFGECTYENGRLCAEDGQEVQRDANKNYEISFGFVPLVGGMNKKLPSRAEANAAGVEKKLENLIKSDKAMSLPPDAVDADGNTQTPQGDWYFYAQGLMTLEGLHIKGQIFPAGIRKKSGFKGLDLGGTAYVLDMSEDEEIVKAILEGSQLELESGYFVKPNERSTVKRGTLDVEKGHQANGLEHLLRLTVKSGKNVWRLGAEFEQVNETGFDYTGLQKEVKEEEINTTTWKPFLEYGRNVRVPWLLEKTLPFVGVHGGIGDKELTIFNVITGEEASKSEYDVYDVAVRAGLRTAIPIINTELEIAGKAGKELEKNKEFRRTDERNVAGMSAAGYIDLPLGTNLSVGYESVQSKIPGRDAEKESNVKLGLRKNFKKWYLPNLEATVSLGDNGTRYGVAINKILGSHDQNKRY